MLDRTGEHHHANRSDVVCAEPRVSLSCSRLRHDRDFLGAGAATRGPRHRLAPAVRQQAPPAGPTASNRGCLHQNAVATDRSVSLLHLAEQAPAEVVGALSQHVQPGRGVSFAGVRRDEQ